MEDTAYQEGVKPSCQEERLSLHRVSSGISLPMRTRFGERNHTTKTPDVLVDDQRSQHTAQFCSSRQFNECQSAGEPFNSKIYITHETYTGRIVRRCFDYSVQELIHY
jgi:hypothetical protein